MTEAMPDQPFGTAYASAYDVIYAEKDYQAECDMLQALFERYSASPVRSVLDLGCGTGNHAFPLAQRGYQVTGVDRSEQMLARARAKLAGPSAADSERGDSTAPEFIQGTIQQLSLERQFDAVLMMFAVIGYLASEAELLAGLEAVRRHLSPNGIFVADFWYGPAVLAIGPTERRLLVDTPDGPLLRRATPSLDREHNRCTVRYRLDGPGGKLLAQESHNMRYFFPDELSERLEAAGMELLTLLPFPEIEGTPDESGWNATLCARPR